MANKKLWAGVSAGQTNKLLDEFNNSFSFDFRLWPYDIQGSLAHAQMLSDQEIITDEDYQAIEQGLNEIKEEISSNPQAWYEKNIDAEDIHMAIEANLTEKIGEPGKKLHTARSRNDQVATDFRLYLRDENENIKSLLQNLKEQFIDLAERDAEYIIPGYTHLQQAQPVSLGHFWLAHYERFARDYERLIDQEKRINVCPLGSGALAGTTYNIDRESTAQQLAFSGVTANSLDSVSDRDFVAEFQFICSLMAIHLSQISEEMIIWASQEFNFITLDDRYATGSSMMPQKRNPDIPELIRGKSGRILGNLQSILVVLKGLPLAYNKDLQEDKEGIFDTIDHLKLSLEIMTDFLDSLKINHNKLWEVSTQGFLNATDLADYLVTKGLSFRDAYKIVGQIVRHCIDNKQKLTEISLETLQKFETKISDDVYKAIDVKNCAEKRLSYGGGSPSNVKEQIKRLRTK